MDQDVHHAFVRFQNLFEHAVVDDCRDSYMFLVDHSHNSLSPHMQLSYDHVYEEETAILDEEETATRDRIISVLKLFECLLWKYSFTWSNWRSG
jgi:hypothetical protein